MPQGVKHTSKADRIAWLLAHPTLWLGYSPDFRNVAKEKVLIEAMQADGLYSRETRWQDINLHKILNQARLQRRLAAAGK